MSLSLDSRGRSAALPACWCEAAAALVGWLPACLRPVMYTRAPSFTKIGCCQADSRVSTSDDSDLSIEFRHIFLKLVG
jgi:hypothetical protein